MKFLRYLLIFVPLAVLAEFVLHNNVLIFIFSALALIPLAGVLGEATEELAIHTGPKIGGLLNATLGNAAELIITIVALQAGKYELIKASLTGSIIGNLLLILGLSLLLGGLRHGVQKFDRNLTGIASSLMLVAVVGLLIPTLFELIKESQVGSVNLQNTNVADPQLNVVSLGVAGVLLLMYVLSLIFQFRSPESAFYDHEFIVRKDGAQTITTVTTTAVSQPDAATIEKNLAATAKLETENAVALPPERFSDNLLEHDVVDAVEHHTPKWSVKKSVIILAITTFAIVIMSEFLVGVVEPVAVSLGIHEFFLGVIVIPIVGNVAEHIVGVQAALKNQMELSLNISLGSSMQIALFVAPLLVFLSLFIGPQTANAGLFGRPLLTLFFSLFEVVVLGLSVIVAAFISVDGESNWLEGALLLGVYVIAAFGFFYL